MITIAIIGGTGMLGQPVARQFISTPGFAVRIVARDAVTAKALFPGTEVVAGDLRDPVSLTSVLRGVDVVYLNLSVTQTEKPTDFHAETDGLKNLLDVARQVGVKRIGYLSSLIMRYQGMGGFRWWVFDIKQEAVRLLRTSGIPYNIFYPSCFMESLNKTQRAGRFILLVGQSAVRPWYVSAQEYGRQVVRAFEQAPDGHNQEYVIQGPEALTQHEAADRFVNAYKKEKLVLLTVPPFFMQLGRPFSAQADYGWHITRALNNYPETFESERTWAELGKPETTIERFAQGHS